MRYSFHGGIPVRVFKKDPRVESFSPKTVILSFTDFYSSINNVNNTNNEVISKPVRLGDHVSRGQLVAYNGDMPVFSPICGTVLSCESGRLIVENDGSGGEKMPFPGFSVIETPLAKTSPELLLSYIRRAAVASPKADAGVDEICDAVRRFDGKRRVIIDCTSAEEHFFANRYIVSNATERLIGGIKILIRACDAIGAVIVTDEGHIPTIRILEQYADDKLIAFIAAEAKYPISDEKLLMHAVLRKECPPNKTPIDFGCAIFDAEACVAVYDAVTEGIPMTDRIITVFDGKADVNLILPIGTKIKDIAEKYQGNASVASFGAYLPSFGIEGAEDTALTHSERTLVLSNRRPSGRRMPCIRCMRCEDVCPMYLSPQRLLMARGKGEKKLLALGADCCIRCNACSSVCPSRIDIPSHFLLDYHIKKCTEIAENCRFGTENCCKSTKNCDINYVNNVNKSEEKEEENG